ncbi:MAG: hypothetical protein Ct9H300mP27_04070 [Chloroflexota bacterium]|nr:MAG: hypothetical protein Ct9H300mP27_04070 [Chloroflexota bacterium]
MWISHDLGVIAGLAHTVNVMYAGSIVERGTVNDIYKSPHHPYTKGLLASMPRLDEITESKLTSIPGRPPNLARLGTGCPFQQRCTYSTERCSIDMPPVNTIGTKAHGQVLELGRSIPQGVIYARENVLANVSQLKKYFPD